MLDLYVGYDERLIAKTSRDLTTFQMPFGALRLVTLPMGWTNSVSIFHNDVTYILQAEIPTYTIPYIDDVSVKGPATKYEKPDGTFETIADNSGIRRFIWEHFQNLNRVMQCMEYAGGTFLDMKLTLCMKEITVVEHQCIPEECLPDESCMWTVRNWGPDKDLSKVQAFLGTIRVARIFIKDFAQRAHSLVQLTRKGVPFEFRDPQLKVMEDLKQALLESPTLRTIDYNSIAPIILAIDTSLIAVGYQLCQGANDGSKKWYFNRFGSIMLNDRKK